MADYFSNFQNILYSFDPDLLEYETVKNIFARVKVIDAILQNSLVYYQYQMKESDDATLVAFKYYGAATRHWMVYFANQVVDPYFDMPLKPVDLNNSIILKYGSLANAQGSLHHVEQQTVVVSSLNGFSNTLTYIATVAQSYTYNFSTNQLQAITLPTITFPTIPVSNTSVLLADGTLVTTTIQLVAVSNYDFEINTNENKRQIQLFDNSYATTIEDQLSSLLSQ